MTSQTENDTEKIQLVNHKNSNSFYHLIEEVYKKRDKKLKLVIEWEILCDIFPKKDVYYGKVYEKNVWYNTARDLLHLLYFDFYVSSVIFLIDDNDPKREEKIEKYQQTFGKFPQSELGLYFDRNKWIKKNAAGFDVFIGSDVNLKDEGNAFSRRSYLVPESSSVEKDWNVDLFIRKPDSLPQVGGLTDQKIIEVIQNKQEMLSHDFKDSEKQVKNGESEKNIVQQPVKKVGSSSNISGFFWGMVIALSVVAVIWFIFRRNRSE